MNILIYYSLNYLNKLIYSFCCINKYKLNSFSICTYFSLNICIIIANIKYLAESYL